MSTIHVVGSINTDLVVRVPRFPSPGETTFGLDFATYPGGKGANQAVAAARLGARVRMVGAVGDDPYGGQRLADLAREGIDVAAVCRLEGVPGGIALIQVDHTGQNTITVVAGANERVTPGQVEAALSTGVAAGDVVCCQLELPEAAVRAALEVGRARGARTVLNAAPLLAFGRDLLSLVDVLIVNEVEAAQLLGAEALGVEDAASAAERLASLGPAVVALTLGARGAYVLGPGARDLVPAKPVVAVDTTA
ncbi:MAG: ribokinase, partial [Thermomicrobiaceae bacterium]|nr:ribokinase [Thermomicrobiaceae bacterium]